MSPSWKLNIALHYTDGYGYYEEYKNKRTLVEYGLVPFETNGTTIEKSDLVRRKLVDSRFGGGVFSFDYKGDKLDASIGGGLNYYKNTHNGKVVWVKNYLGELNPDHEYYRNIGRKTDGNIYAKINYEILDGVNFYADMQYRYLRYKINGNNDKWDWTADPAHLQPLNIDEDFSFFNPKAGIFWKINNNNNLYASFSVANKEPTRNNYTDNLFAAQPKSERMFDYEVGYTFRKGWFNAGVNLYYMDYKNQLVLNGQLNEIGEAVAENVKDSYRMGIELMAGARITNWLRWDINATWSKNRIQDFVESLPGYHYNADGSSTSLPTVQIKHKDTHIAFSPDFLFNNRFSFNYKGFEAALQSQFVSKQYMTNAEVEELTLDKYFVSNLNLAYTFRPKKVLKEVTVGFTVYNLFNEKYENNGWASSDYTDTVENRGDYAGYAAQAGTNVMGHVSFRF